MKLTPLDIHHKEFGLALRGYNQAQVDQFLDEVADEFERLFKENIDLSEKLDAANQRVREYSEMENTLRATMLSAQRSAEEIKAKAEKDADLLMRDAEIKAKELVQSALSEKQRHTADFMTVKAAEDDFRLRFRELLEDYMRRIDEVPVAEDVQALVGMTEQRPVAPPPIVAEMIAEAALAPPAAIPDFGSEIDAGATQSWDFPSEQPAPPEEQAAEPDRSDQSGRPRATPGPGMPESPQAMQVEPPQGGFVQSLTLGETRGPDLGAETPDFGEPSEFPRYGGVGERDDDLDIEQID